MKLLGLDALDRHKRKHADASNALEAWKLEVQRAKWRRPVDVCAGFASASFIGDSFIIFNIKGNRYRLVVTVDYPRQAVNIEWFGTHAQYDRKRFP